MTGTHVVTSGMIFLRSNDTD